MYRLVGVEPEVWFDHARGLLSSAEVLRDRLLNLRAVPAGDRRVETNGLFHAIMLLLGMSMENVIKGAYIARHPKLVTEEGLDVSHWNHDGGHAIKRYAAGLIQLSATESECLDRLQEHIVWAARYPIHKKAARFNNGRDKRRLAMSDFEIAHSLVAKFSQLRPAVAEDRE